MRTKQVWQTDSDGYLIGQSMADESPLEPGVYLIPAGGVEGDPPGACAKGKVWRWAGGAWVQAKAPKVKRRIAARVAGAVRALLHG